VERVYSRLEEARDEAGVPRWDRRPALDRLATLAAEEAAAAGGRGLRRAIEDLLDESGVRGVTRVVPLIQSLKGYDAPVAVALDHWRGYRQAWTDLMAPDLHAIGIGEAYASDGTLVVVAVLVEDTPVFDLTALALDLELQVNELRARHGLSRLKHSDELARVARDHSRDMAAREYFEHESPEGRNVADRVRSAGVAYKTVGENLARVQDSKSPASDALESWMISRTHREIMMKPELDEGGIGAAIDDDGVIYFTQVYLQTRALGEAP
jgi:uncharacterized protein YkwD